MTAEVPTLNVSAALGQTIVVSDYETLTVTTSGTATSLALTAAATTDLYTQWINNIGNGCCNCKIDQCSCLHW